MRILIADDHALFSDGLASLLQAEGYEIAGQATNGRQAVEMTLRIKPDLVLMDLTMPELDGLGATRLIKADAPDVKVVILTAVEDDDKLFEAIKYGAEGYLVKNLESDQFLSLLRRVAAGEPGLSPGVARKLLAEFAHPRRTREDPDALTSREMEVLELLVQGVTTNRKLARTLGVSENTVKFHVRNILDKLHVNNRAQVVSYALRNRLVEAPPPDATE
ncbi:MAG: response regulator transcription factor [Thermoanaerobaculia bacterium]|nr:response regulator transcription factor [Thermoanaerobaculia bacterium]